mmetsp:Transcript_3618/g.8015  ORF Transcript_3618/g.8015 Transcript_3618/m.8015 type:complete len:185 (-) Transcript_3618:3347-3901(-)
MCRDCCRSRSPVLIPPKSPRPPARPPKQSPPISHAYGTLTPQIPTAPNNQQLIPTTPGVANPYRNQQEQQQAQQQKLHPSVEAMMRPYLDKFKRVQLNQILNAINKNIKVLPTLPTHLEDGKSAICYNSVFKDCNQQYCRFPKGQLDPKNIPTEFADEFCKVLYPGVKYVLKNRQPKLPTRDPK